MRPVTAKFLAALTGAHAMATSCRIASHAAPPALGASLQIQDGSVILDANADIRGTLDLTVEGAWPNAAVLAADGRVSGAAAMAHPYGVQVQVSRGIRYGTGATELVTLGTFVVTAIEQDGLRSTPAIRITGQDRAHLVAGALLDTAVQFAATDTWDTFLAYLLTSAHTELTYSLDFPGTTTLGADLLVEEGADPWKTIRDAAAALGKAAWFDADGICKVTSPPDPGTAVWTVASGPGGVMVSTGRHMTRDGQYNGMLAIGEDASDIAPARGVAYDLGPGSLTAWGDAFGRRLKVLRSSLIVSDADAAAAAQTELRRTVGLPYGLNLEAVPNPALEPWDVLAVQHAAGDIELHVVDRVTVPLSADQPVQLATRDTTTVVVG